MSSRQKRFAVIVSILFGFLSHDLTCATDLQGPYIGQEPPGFTPKIFAPGVVSLPNRFDYSGSFSPDGNEFYFTYSNLDWSGNRIMVTRQENGYWTTPATVPFSGLDIDWSVYLSPDGQKLFFSSGRPNMSWVLNIWMCERQGDGWSDPIKLDMNVGDRSDYVGTCTWDGTLYFASKRDLPKPTDEVAIYRSVLVNGNYTHVEKLPAPINTGQDNNPYIVPDESYLLFTSRRNGHDNDLYISFRNMDDSWTEPVNLGPCINTFNEEGNPFLSPDGKYLFFVRDTGVDSSPRTIDMYWVSIGAFLPDPNGPIENLASSQRFASINCAISYAKEGDTIVLQPGAYKENITIGKDITLQSVDPNEPYYIGSTIIQGDANNPVLTLDNNSEACEIAGLTLRAGAVGISGTAVDATIRNCRIMDNVTDGIELSEQSNTHLLHCLITSNGQTGIKMLSGSGRGSPSCKPVIENCIIVDNGDAAIEGGDPVVIDSIISESTQL